VALGLRGGGVSIHAPARGATGVAPRPLDPLDPFQSTLPRGERHNSRPRPEPVDRFQSTLPRGERPPPAARQELDTPVSIHAPARGATSVIEPLDGEPGRFNPRSREGSDLIS